MCTQYIVDKIPSRMFLFTTHLFVLVKYHGARQSATDSAQLVDQIRPLYESKLMAFKALYAKAINY